MGLQLNQAGSGSDSCSRLQSAASSLMKFGKRLDTIDGKHVESSLAIHETGGSEDMEVRMEPEIIAEGLNGRNGGELAIR